MKPMIGQLLALFAKPGSQRAGPAPSKPFAEVLASQLPAPSLTQTPGHTPGQTPGPSHQTPEQALRKTRQATSSPSRGPAAEPRPEEWLAERRKGPKLQDERRHRPARARGVDEGAPAHGSASEAPFRAAPQPPAGLGPAPQAMLTSLAAAPSGTRLLASSPPAAPASEAPALKLPAVEPRLSRHGAALSELSAEAPVSAAEEPERPAPTEEARATRPPSEPALFLEAPRLEAASPPGGLPAPLALTELQRVVPELLEDPTLRASIDKGSARVLLEVQGERVALELTISEGAARVKLDGPPLGQHEQVLASQLRAVLATAGLTLGGFEMSRQDAHAQRADAEDEPSRLDRRRRSEHQGSEPVLASGDGHIHVRA